MNGHYSNRLKRKEYTLSDIHNNYNRRREVKRIRTISELRDDLNDRIKLISGKGYFLGGKAKMISKRAIAMSEKLTRFMR